MTAPRTPPSTARSGAHDPATVFVRTVAEAVRQSKIAVQNDPAPLANPLTAGTHLTGGSYNGSVSVIFATDATSANTASTIVARDASGDFVAGTITAALSGNATTATSATSATTAGTVTTAAQPAITSIGTLTGLTVKGTVAISGSSSGAVSFVAQSAAGSTTYVLPNADGSNNQVLTTDGSGNLSWSVKTGGSGGTISTINGDGSAAQTLAAGAGLTIVNAGPVHTLALDLNYAPTYTTTITAAGFAGPLTGNVTGNLTGTVLTASQPDITTAANLTTIGTLVAGAVPASLVTAGTFGAGNFAFPGNLTVGTDAGGTRVLALDAAASNVRDLRWQTAGVNRWIARADSAAESGANAGSNFDLIALDDSGSVIGNPLTINRATMAAGFSGTLSVTSTLSASNFSGSSSGTNTGDQTSFAWSAVTGTPTTLSGYGITDAYTKTAADARYAAIAGPFPWADVSGAPTTLSGYGITDAYTKTAGDARYSPIAGSSSIVTVGTLGSLAIGTQFSFNGSSGAFAMQLISFDPAGTNIVTLTGIGLRITAPLGGATRFDADQNTGAITTASSITTGTPSGGTAAPWKMGSLITTLFSGALIPTQYVELDVSGTLCKLALIT